MKKRMFLGITLLSLFSLVGCSGSYKYHATLYESSDWVTDSFAKENKVQDAKYGSKKTDAESYPTSRTITVEDSAKYKGVFNDGVKELETDFDKQMLVVYTTYSIYHRDLHLESIDLKNGTMTITIKEDDGKIGVGYASAPYQRWMIVKQDKVQGISQYEVIFDE